MKFAALFLVVLAFSVTTHLLFYRWGYRRGVADGEGHGRIRADNWWLNVEREISLEREKIWREEAQL